MPGNKTVKGCSELRPRKASVTYELVSYSLTNQRVMAELAIPLFDDRYLVLRLKGLNYVDEHSRPFS
jgi:hypothetical protein